jgi:hypothetical protein
MASASLAGLIRSATMAGDIVVIPLADRTRWEAAAGESRVPSHAWEFCAALADSGPAPNLARISNAGSLLIMPFVERGWAGTLDITTITTVSGAAWFDPDPVLLDGWSDYARSRGWVAGYVQLHPETDLSRVPSADPGNSVFVADLRASDLLAGASTIVRRKLKRATAAGARLCEDRHRVEEAVVRLYRETMVRVQAHGNYAYSEWTLRRWIRDPKSVVLGASAGDGIEACALFLQRDDQAEYHLGASTSTARGLQTLLSYAMPGAKVMARPRAIAGLAPGSHDVRKQSADQSIRRFAAADLLIAHVPFSTAERFARKLYNIRTELAQNPACYYDDLAWHWKRWSAMSDRDAIGRARCWTMRSSLASGKARLCDLHGRSSKSG